MVEGKPNHNTNLLKDMELPQPLKRSNGGIRNLKIYKGEPFISRSRSVTSIARVAPNSSVNETLSQSRFHFQDEVNEIVGQGGSDIPKIPMIIPDNVLHAHGINIVHIGDFFGK